jgi:hypothetical protein
MIKLITYVILSWLTLVGVALILDRISEHDEPIQVAPVQQVTCEWHVHKYETHVFPCTLVSTKTARVDL